MTDEHDELIREIRRAVSDVLEEMHEGFDRIIGKPRHGVSTDKHAELIEAAKAVLPLLEASTDFHNGMKKAREAGPDAELAYIIDRKPVRDETPAQKHRREADEMEVRDAAIKRFREAVAAMSD